MLSLGDVVFRPKSPLAGLRIIEDRRLTDTVEDWSGVRSRARAERRRRQGHSQRVRYMLVPKPDVFQIGDALVMHPEIARRIEREFAQRLDAAVAKSFFGQQ